MLRAALALLAGFASASPVGADNTFGTNGKVHANVLFRLSDDIATATRLGQRGIHPGRHQLPRELQRAVPAQYHGHAHGHALPATSVTLSGCDSANGNQCTIYMSQAFGISVAFDLVAGGDRWRRRSQRARDLPGAQPLREGQRHYGALSSAAFVDLVYQNVLGRLADAGARRSGSGS